ncbi:MAG: family 10 glycosylhydrolase [Prevotella sp.]|jgi:hypothetical protein|nr:family 10 glycosylhydrolase [Prevotella sp.]
MRKVLLVVVFAFMVIILSAKTMIPLYVWEGMPKNATAQSLKADFEKWKEHGVVGVCINVGFDVDKARMAAKAAHEEGLVFHAWIPTMLQQGLDSTWYTVNRLGQSAYDHPAYVPYYKTLDPRNPNVQKYLIKKFCEIAAIPDVDYVQLDYIRYADAILAKALWPKYGLIENGEWPAADYCYCDSCVAAYKRLTGIDIRKVSDPSKIKSWAQFRCDAITHLVNLIADSVHAMGKKVSVDVFPGPYSRAVWMVRQEWNKWNVDACFPMNYNDFYLEPPSWVVKVTREEVKSMKGRAPVYSGLFICKDWQDKSSGKDPETLGLSPDELADVVRKIKKTGAGGICLFTPGSMTDAHWTVLDQLIKR